MCVARLLPPFFVSPHSMIWDFWIELPLLSFFGCDSLVVLGCFFEGSQEAFTQKSEQLGRGLKFQLLARVNLLYGAFKMSIAWARFPC